MGPRVRKSPALLWLFALALIAGFALLGRWQLSRAVEKQAMLDAVSRVLAERAAQPLAAAKDLPTDQPYAWTRGSGRFLEAPALLLDNQRRGDAVGVRVFRVFQPQPGQALLVDLGWLRMDGQRDLPEVSAIRQSLVIEGLLTPPPATGLALGPAYVEAQPDRWLLTRVDLPALSKALKVELAPRVLRLDPEFPLGYARDLDVLPNTLPPERHRGYALQWFGLAAATFAFALFLSLRRPRP